MATYVRHRPGKRRKHRLSIKSDNNAVSWLAVRPFLKDLKPGDPGYRPPPPPPAPILDTALPGPLPDALAEAPPQLSVVGRIGGQYGLEAAPAFAVVEIGGFQYKVTADDVIFPFKLHGVGVNDVLRLGRVLLLGTPQATVIGRPYIPGAFVMAAVEEQFKDAKVLVFKKKKSKRYTKLSGHRDHLTTLRILHLGLPEGHEAAQQLPPPALPIVPVVQAQAAGRQQGGPLG